MKILNRMIITALALLPGLLLAADATGVWKASFDTQVGTQTYTYHFTVEGNTLTGTIESSIGEATLSAGMVDGNKISFTESVNYQGMDLVITYTGEIVSDNEINFTRDVGGFGMETLTAVRSTE